MKWLGILAPILVSVTANETFLFDAKAPIDQDYDCRGEYGKVKVCYRLETNSKGHFLGFNNNEASGIQPLFHSDVKGRLLMIERQKFEFDGENAEADWRHEVAAKMKSNMRVFYEQEGMLIVSVEDGNMEDVMDELTAKMPRNAVLLPLPQYRNEQPIDFVPATNTLEQENEIKALIGRIKSEYINRDVRYLTGEDSSIITRNSQSANISSVASWLTNRFISLGFFTTHHYFKENWGGNIIA